MWKAERAADTARQLRLRRPIRVVLLAAAFLTTTLALAPSPAPLEALITIKDSELTVSARQQDHYFAPGAVGLSTEEYELGSEDLSASHHELVALMRSLGPGTLRIGGDTADEAWWTSTHRPAPVWAVVTVTPASLRMLEGLLVASGWKAIIAVDFGHYDIARAVNQATFAQRILGPHLAGIEIGNEPNDFNLGGIDHRPGYYGFAEYLSQVESYARSIKAALPNTEIVGPDTSSEAWFDYITTRPEPFDVLTEHYYPTVYNRASALCPGTTIPRASDLLSGSTLSAETKLLHNLAAAAATAGKPFFLDETNDTSSCDEAGGPATSPVYASALWSLDWSLRSMSAGAAGIEFHSEFGQCGTYAYTPICATDRADEDAGIVRLRPEYFGLLAAAQLEGGRFLPVHVESRDPARAVSVYATSENSEQLKLAVINMNLGRSLDVTLADPWRESNVSTAKLMAASAYATARIRFGTWTETLNGLVKGRSAKPAVRHRFIQIDLPPGSAEIVTLTERSAA